MKAPLLLAVQLSLFTAMPAAEEIRNPFDGDAAIAAEGHALFQKAGCHPCHGLEARGSTGPDLTDDEWRYRPTDEMLYRTISKGRKGTPMPAFEGKLKPEEVWKIVEFLRAQNRQRKAGEASGQ